MIRKIFAAIIVPGVLSFAGCTAMFHTQPLPPQASKLPSIKLIMPHIFGDHMVIQRGKPVRVWGWAAPGAEITAEINGKQASCTVGGKGTWLLELPSMKAGGPYTLSVSDGENVLKFKDVLIGEVWICSGQSNMEWPLKGTRKCPVENSSKEIKVAHNSELRLLKVGRAASCEPKYDFSQWSWSVCTPGAAAYFSATAYFFGRKLQSELGVPVGLVLSAWGGTPCQSWCSNDVIKKFPDYEKMLQKKCKNKNKSNKAGPWTPTALYNAMIQPLVPFSIAGFIWYQGEANRKHSKEYTKLFPAMITDWRKKFQQGNLPFFYCQIAPFHYREKDAGVKMREAQREVLDKLPNLGMVVLSDKTTVYNIHPPYKKDAGERLAAWALNKVYGSNIPFSGPLFKSFSVKGDTVTVKFDYADGLRGKTNGFEVAGADGKFYKASAEIHGDTVIVKSPEVKAPVAVRYAWGNTCTGGLFNSVGLPASSFTTEDWKD